MGTLYIIGNGFDLHHGLRTKPDDFIKCLYLQSVYNETDNAFDMLNFYGVDWNEYEQSLAYLDLNEIEEHILIYPDYLSDRESDRDGGILNMQMYVESLGKGVNAALEQMVEDANGNLDNIEPKDEGLLKFQIGDAILSFNYTSTLERLYYVPEDVPVYHIHGSYENNDELIFGYSYDVKRYDRQWVDRDGEDGDYYVNRQREEEYWFYESLGKKYQMDKLNFFLRKCSWINRIKVIGHSMGKVDAAYMEEIERFICPDIWEISYHDRQDIKRIDSMRYSFNNKIDFFPY